MAHIITDAEAQSLVKIANSIIGPLVNKGLIKKNDMPDAVQGLLMEAVRLSQSYDENTNAQFSTYAHGVMNVQVFRIIRKQYSATNRILSEAISLDEILDAEDSDDAPDYNRIGIMPGSLIGDEQEANRQELFACIQEVIRTLPEEQLNLQHASQRTHSGGHQNSSGRTAGGLPSADGWHLYFKNCKDYEMLQTYHQSKNEIYQKCLHFIGNFSSNGE